MLRIQLHHDFRQLAAQAVWLLARGPYSDAHAATNVATKATTRGAAADHTAFHSDVLIVPDVGVGRWLSHRLADATGVSSLLRIELAGRFLWETITQVLGDVAGQSPFEPATTRWLLLEQLEKLAHGAPPATPGLASLLRRFTAASPLQRLRLADEIARLFERYLAYRRDWLDAWEHGRTIFGSNTDPPADVDLEGWQSLLWVTLVRRVLGGERAHPFDDFAARLRAPLDPAAHAALCERLRIRQILVFGQPAFGAESLEQFALVSRLVPVTFLIPNPCRQFWGDLLGNAQIAAIQAQRPDIAWLYDEAPSILGAWGQGQRDYLAQVRALATREQVAIEDADPATTLDAPGNVLQAVQQAVLDRSDDPWLALAASSHDPAHDPSIQVHGCHGVMRQVEVLHDCLLRNFAQDPTLRPDEVVVLCPQPERFVAAIRAVFGACEPAIPYRIAATATGQDALVEATNLLLATAQDVSRGSVMTLLENVAIAQALGMSAADLREIDRWLDEAGTLRGLDAEAGPRNFTETLERLLLGAAIAPHPGELPRPFGSLTAIQALQAGDAALLERLLKLLEWLRELGEHAREIVPLQVHCTRLQQVLDRLFEPLARRVPDWLESFATVRRSLRALLQSADQAGDTARIDLAGFAWALGEMLTTGAPAVRPAGSVLFAPIGSMRRVPYKVIALLGMDEDVFPRVEPRRDDDLMQRRPRFGDRLARNDDRATFLDAVLAAGSCLVILFDQRSQQNNQPHNPAPVVGELLGYLHVRLGPVPDDHGGASARPGTVIEHSLQPFAACNFSGAPIRSFSAHWARVAQALQLGPRRNGIEPLPSATHDVAKRESGQETGQTTESAQPRHAASPAVAAFALSHDELLQGLAKPAQTHLQLHRQIVIPRLAQDIESDEALELQPALQADRVQAVLDAWLAGSDADALEAAVLADPHLPADALGLHHARVMMLTWDEFREKLGPQAQPPCRVLPFEVTVSIDHAVCRLTLHTGHVVLASPDAAGVAPMSGSGGTQIVLSAYPRNVRTLLNTWLAHLAWCGLVAQSVGPSGLPTCTTVLIHPGGRDEGLERFELPYLPDWEVELCSLARAVLALREVAPALFPRTYLAFTKKAGDTTVAELPDDHDAMHEAHKVLSGDPDAAYGTRAELDDEWFRTLFREGAPALRPLLLASEAVYRAAFLALRKRPRKVAADEAGDEGDNGKNTTGRKGKSGSGKPAAGDGKKGKP